tara:strand:+ start:6496 stop:8421 length:1926 start_codon:yes stop_codon:yes gene_type:complete
MKVAYKHLVSHIPSKPGIFDISEKFFQLGHEHEIINGDIYDIELTPNRGDCLSIKGLLRDLAVFYEVNPDFEIYKNDLNPLKINFTNNAPNACPHISFCKIDLEGDIEPYKGELKNYFDDMEVNKINFFTDISNYISYETGQPTHCYDARKIKNNLSLDISSLEHEFETLIDKKIKLSGENLVFVEKDGTVINLAGIMGSMNTSCTSDTKSVIIECAYFNPEIIIGKSVKYDINSDAAYKFERGVDPLCHEKVLRRFIKIVNDHSKIKNIEIFKKDYSDFKPNSIPLDDTRLNDILGTSLSKNQLREYLLKLGFDIRDSFALTPSYRSDIKTENDIAEEIARIIGYDNIQAQPLKIQKEAIVNCDSKHHEELIKNFLINNGFFEVISNPFVNSERENSIKIDNPLDSKRKYLRTDLQESLVESLLYNEKRQKDSVKLFEIAEVYYSSDGIKNNKKLGIICSGRLGRNYKDFSKKINQNYLIDMLKGLSDKINFKPLIISRDNLNSKIKSQIIYLEIELDDLKDHQLNHKFKNNKKLSRDNFLKYNQISNYPSSTRDLSFSIKDIDRYYELQNHILSFKHELLKEIFIFDFFVNKKNNEIKLGIRFIFQSKKSTITDQEVNKLMDKIIKSSLVIESVNIPGL